MAYNSYYTLSPRFLIGNKVAALADETPLLDIIEEVRNTFPDACYCLTKEGESNGRGKWYECSENIAAISKKYPNVLFIIHREGEDSGDIENVYILNGKVQVAKAILTIPTVDIDALLKG